VGAKILPVNFDPTPEQALLRETVRSFVATECSRELVRELDRERRFPHELWARLGELGLLGIAIPPEFGGEGAGAVEQAIVTEELARGPLALAVAYVNTACLAGKLIAAYPLPLRERLISNLIAGQLLASFAWTEPSAGSDILSMRATASRTPDGAYVVNGGKTFVTMAGEADYILTIVRTRVNSASRSDGLSCLLIPTTAEGLSIQPIGKVGQRSAPFYDVYLSDVEVPAEQLIGDEHQAWQQLLPLLGAERALFAAICLGIARQAFADAVEYSLAREAFGRTIAHFQAIQHHIADMKTMIDGSELLTYRAAWLAASGRSAGTEATQALMVAATTANDVADRGMQILGAASYTEEFDMERYWRDARAFRVSPVTTEVAKNVIARDVGLPRSY
jgi:acyl-CoA dehydrogenase